MIPRDFITEWRAEAPWIDDRQVEQDLVISRALVEIFSDKRLRRQLAFRGGTALYKLFLKPPARYSEDIDLVQIDAGPAGDLMDRLHAVLDPWLGRPRYRQTEGRVTFTYRFGSEETPPVPLRLKVEINTREHFSVYGTSLIPFEVYSRWFEGGCDIPSYGLNELLGTKLRALYQRKKGRDLFDLDVALQHKDELPQEIIAAFRAYMDHGGHTVTRQQLQDNLAAKLEDPDFNSDISTLLRSDFEWDPNGMAERVSLTLLDHME